MTDYVLQSPGETIRRSFDFTDALPNGVTVSSAVVTATGATSGTPATSSPFVSVDVSGVSFGRIAKVVCAATLSTGEVVEKQLVIRGGQR